MLPRRPSAAIHSLRSPCQLLWPQSQPQRPFFSFPPGSPLTPPPQTLAASRTLPYHHTKLYDIIADVDSYSSFVPYCSVSRVTHWSDPDANAGRRWPVRADLSVGWGGFEETYTSRLCCVPARGIVEAISGDAVSQLPEASSIPGPTPLTGSSVFKSLVTRWTITPAGQSTTAMARATAHLNIEFQFVNPIYAAVSATVSDRIAVMMVEAFERRAMLVLGGRSALQ